MCVPDGEGGHAGHKGKGLAEQHACYRGALSVWLCCVWWKGGKCVRRAEKKRTP